MGQPKTTGFTSLFCCFAVVSGNEIVDLISHMHHCSLYFHLLLATPTTSCKQTRLIDDVTWIDINFELGGIHWTWRTKYSQLHIVSSNCGAVSAVCLTSGDIQALRSWQLDKICKVTISKHSWWSDRHVEWANTRQFYMLPRKPSTVRWPVCELLGFLALSNGNSPP